MKEVTYTDGDLITIVNLVLIIICVVLLLVDAFYASSHGGVGFVEMMDPEYKNILLPYLQGR